MDDVCREHYFTGFDDDMNNFSLHGFILGQRQSFLDLSKLSYYVIGDNLTPLHWINQNEKMSTAVNVERTEDGFFKRLKNQTRNHYKQETRRSKRTTSRMG